MHTQLAAAAVADSLGLLERRTTSTLTAPTTSLPSRVCRAPRRLAWRGASWRPSSPRALRRRAAHRTWERRRREAAGAARRSSHEAARGRLGLISTQLVSEVACSAVPPRRPLHLGRVDT